MGGGLMPITVDATYQDGVLKPDLPLALPDGSRVHVVIEGESPARTTPGSRLRELRAKIVESGSPQLGWDDISDEVSSHRGGWRENR
jgi:predicted DNA-binding antitoxin AbrB/MazE fold protein